MALHLCLLIGQFVILHLKTEITHRHLDTAISSSFNMQLHSHLSLKALMTFSFWLNDQCMQHWWNRQTSTYSGAKHYVTISESLEHYLWYWACRNWNSSLILSHDSATVNLKPGWPGWWGAWKTTITSIKLNYIPREAKFVFQRTHSAPAGSTSNISGPVNRGGGIFPIVTSRWFNGSHKTQAVCACVWEWGQETNKQSK